MRLEQEPAGVGHLDPLGEDEHRGVGELGTDAHRRPHSLVGVGRRHPHVGDDQLGPVLDDGRHQLAAVADRGDDLEPVLAQDQRDAVAQQRVVLGEYDTHGRPHFLGSLIAMTVGPPSGLSMASDPSSASTRRRSPSSPVPDVARPAPPLPLSHTVSS